jgi:hypothetical protein
MQKGASQGNGYAAVAALPPGPAFRACRGGANGGQLPTRLSPAPALGGSDGGAGTKRSRGPRVTPFESLSFACDGVAPPELSA